MIGYGFMGQAHSNAFLKFPSMFWPPVARVRLRALAGRTEDAVAEAAARYGYEGYYTDWHDLVADDRITLVDNVAWHTAHVEPSIAALDAGKHVLCEKPLATNTADARRMRDAARRAEAAGIKHMVAFNYRFAPAVRLARELIAGGHLGRVHRVHVTYLQDHQADPDKVIAAKYRQGKTGVLLGLGSHAIDLVRYLVGEPTSVTGYLRTVVPQRPDGQGGTVTMPDDDTAIAQLELENGAVGTLAVSYVSAGRKNHLTVEVNGLEGSLNWDLEDLNRLHVFRAGRDKVAGLAGFENVQVTEGQHPLMQYWWPPGHILSWEHLHANLIEHFVRAVATGGPVAPHGATFEDGYRANAVSDAVEESWRTGRRVAVTY
ncbi:MAG: Gfo/Idh/MocA family protein [Chloroflexota bacterium]